MEVSVENIGGLERRITVQIPSERFESEIDSRLKSMSRSIRLDGFRVGKVPMDVVRKKFGRQVREDVLNQLVNSSLQEALSRENLHPAGNPQIDTRNPGPGEALEFVATFEIFPSLDNAIQYNFTVNRPVTEISEADIATMLENLRRQRATWEAVTRASQAGDQVVIDFEGTIDGQPFSGNKASNAPVVIGSGGMIKGFEEQIAGMSAGDEKTIQVEFPADYPSAEVAGKQAAFLVKVNSVAAASLPEMDENFAKSFGIESAGMEGLKADVTENMRREMKGLISARIKEQVFQGLLDSNPIDVPKNLVAQEMESLQAQDKARSRSGTDLKAVAERRVKLGVLVSELARTNKIQIDPARVRSMIETIASSYESPDQVVQWYYSNQEMLANVQSSVIEEQVAEWVIEHGGATVVDQEISFNQLVEEARRTQGL
jgi:trigger factor